MGVQNNSSKYCWIGRVFDLIYYSPLNFVARGECQVGIVYATDAAISKDVKVAGIFPENTHSPIIYPLGLIKKNPNSTKFYQFLQSNQAKAVFKKYGFSVLAPVKP
ncbi:extracellular solute-binding protein [Acinetobacter baumannii]|nr:extracellular solute-binding protein [Acinetobacter baumannii]